MIATRFRSVGWVASVAVAALGCYLVSQRVASERAGLERIEHRILLAKLDIRKLQTELGTRSRQPELERWNSDVLALSAPGAAQYLRDDVQLVSLITPVRPQMDARVQQASAVVPAPAPDTARAPAPAPVAAPAPPLLQHATYTPPAAGAPKAERVALLDAGLLDELGRAAATEAGAKKHAR
jgi:hypothetical protein